MVSQINQCYIRNASTTYNGIYFHYAESFNDNIMYNNISMAQPGAATTSNFGVLLGGMKRMITINFVLRDDGSIKGFSSYQTPSVTNLKEQWLWLMQTVCQPTGSAQFNSKFVIGVYVNGAVTSFSGLLESIDLKWSGDGTALIGTLTLQETA
jgi:hypothetical protein